MIKCLFDDIAPSNELYIHGRWIESNGNDQLEALSGLHEFCGESKNGVHTQC